MSPFKKLSNNYLNIKHPYQIKHFVLPNALKWVKNTQILQILPKDYQKFNNIVKV